MFAYNEAGNITKSITSIFNNSDDNLAQFHVIANGCTDNTVDVAKRCKQDLGFDKLVLSDLEIGDKCNAWNHYMHDLAPEVDTHFFVDADVKFSANCFAQMHEKLISTPSETVAIAGMPLSGRNIAFYRSLIIERACFFGNLYGLKHSFVQRVREEDFYLPVGLNWIDSFLTKAVNTDLAFFNYNLPDRTTYQEGVGYYFDSLSPFKKDDIKLYINRIARYELGKLQEVHLDSTPVKSWPRNLHALNLAIRENFEEESKALGFIKKRLVRKRLNKLIKKGIQNEAV